MASEQTRDLRSSAQDSKRFKEHTEKWSRGARPSAGVKFDLWNDMCLSGSEAQREKIRPERHLHQPRLTTQNIVKPRGSGQVRHDVPQSYSRARMDALVELQDPSNISRSLHELMPSPQAQRSFSIADNVLYSFDRAETPGKPLSLEVFVKTNPKETEKFVEKEYEILDQNGDALKGRKARQNLRRRGPVPTTEESIIEDDGFELV
ncbi:hypothetical protein F5Y04DRAFT_54355 [Hypomontagnella monticulosa]|nr:hypothetical protein F5Y04DRAFT_54355 [Hypomontagnella monticulosa]